MRLWSLHPAYLDSKGLVACWREGLLAQKVLLGETKGYKHHPQLERFNVVSIGTYLRFIVREARQRNYSFDETKIVHRSLEPIVMVTTGQLDYEAKLLALKLWDRGTRGRILLEPRIVTHPMFVVTEGPVESWEKINGRIK